MAYRRYDWRLISSNDASRSGDLIPVLTKFQLSSGDESETVASNLLNSTVSRGDEQSKATARDAKAMMTNARAIFVNFTTNSSFNLGFANSDTRHRYYSLLA